MNRNPLIKRIHKNYVFNDRDIIGSTPVEEVVLLSDLSLIIDKIKADATIQDKEYLVEILNKYFGNLKSSIEVKNDESN